MEVELNEITTSGQMSLLYEAAYSGNVSMLDSLIRQRTHILHKTSQTAFAETPLHISSLLGHLQFTEKLVTLKPDLVLEVDSSRMTALHLASAEGHIRIVKELLKVNSEPCLLPDEEGRIPLHYAAMRGRTRVVEELIKAKPESLSFRDKGKSVFHLCVTYNHLHTLRALVESECAIYGGKLLNFTSSDDAGNTILHSAITLKRVEVISYLLSIPKIREIASLKNNAGFTAHNILEQSQKDLQIREIQHMLTMAEKEEFETDDPHPPPPTSTDVVPPQNDGRHIKMFKCIKNFFMKILKWIVNWSQHEDTWLKEMKGNLSLVSTVIATITFQALNNPPGGFIQQGSQDDPLSCNILDDNHPYCPGQVMASSSKLHRHFEDYLAFVTVCFFSSLSVTLLLVSGIFPKKNKAVIWVISIAMCITIKALAAAYITAAGIIMPDHFWQEKYVTNLKKAPLYRAWSKLPGIIAGLVSFRFYICVVKKSILIIKKSKNWGTKNGCRRLLFELFRISVFFVLFVIGAVLFSVAVFVFTVLGY